MVIPVYEIEARDAEDASSPFAVLEVRRDLAAQGSEASLALAVM